MKTQKDPACLFYIDTWLSSTAEMDSDVRGWYLNLILHQYDKKDLPNDIEKLAVLSGVKFSEFERFKQMFEQVLKHKFVLNDNNRYENSYAKTILQGREQFKDKRTKSGTIGYLIKLSKEIKKFTNKEFELFKQHLFTLDENELNEAKNKQVLEQMLQQVLEQNVKLYINGNENGNKYIDNKEKFKNELSAFVEVYGADMCNRFYNYWTELNQSKTKMKFELEKTFEISKRLNTWSSNELKFSNAKK